jgi:hypothetical protein
VSAALLEHSLAASKQQPWQPLPLLAVAFVTQQLEARRGAASAASAEELGGAYRRLLAAALQHLQALGERQAAAARGRGAAAPPALLRAGTAGCYRLLRALRAHMPPSAFLSALAALAAGTPADRVRRKALQLLATAAREAAEDASLQEDAEEAAAAAEAALAACDAAVALLLPGGGGGGGDAASPLTKQTALAAVGTVAAAFGPSHPARLLQVLPPVLAATADSAAAVRGSALGATASLAVALGPRLVPQLPAAVAAVLAAVGAAAAVVAAATPAAAARHDAAAAAGGDSDSEGDAAGGQRQGSVDEGAALELAAALAAAAALVEHLGAFLAPHLPQLLQVLLHPAILQVRGCTGRGPREGAAAYGGAAAAALALPAASQLMPAARTEQACAVFALLEPSPTPSTPFYHLRAAVHGGALCRRRGRHPAPPGGGGAHPPAAAAAAVPAGAGG